MRWPSTLNTEPSLDYVKDSVLSLFQLELNVVISGLLRVIQADINREKYIEKQLLIQLDSHQQRIPLLLLHAAPSPQTECLWGGFGALRNQTINPDSALYERSSLCESTLQYLWMHSSEFLTSCGRLPAMRFWRLDIAHKTHVSYHVQKTGFSS